jgi:hypothetical protein
MFTVLGIGGMKKSRTCLCTTKVDRLQGGRALMTIFLSVNVNCILTLSHTFHFVFLKLDILKIIESLCRDILCS